MKYGECWGCSPEEKSGGQEGSFSKWMRCWKSEWVEEEGRSERETSHVREVKAGVMEVFRFGVLCERRGACLSAWQGGRGAGAADKCHSEEHEIYVEHILSS